MKRVISTGEITVESAARNVRDYFTEIMPKSGTVRTGARFDSWAGGGDAPETANRITADDLVAVSFLSVKVPARAAIGLLDTQAGEVAGLLSAIPTDLELRDADPVADLGPDSPAHRLWDLVRGRQVDGGNAAWGIGPTTASKILARKRPRLVPVYDSIIRRVTSLAGSGEQWTQWHAAFGDGVLDERLTEIRHRSGITAPVADLRLLDVVLWMHGKRQGLQPQDEDLEFPASSPVSSPASSPVTPAAR